MIAQIIAWAVTLAVLLIIEAATAQLVTIWFAAGALVSLIAAAIGTPIWLQLLLFGVVSGITLAVTRPLVRKVTKRKPESLNAERCVGDTAIVTEKIDNIEAKGAVKVGGVVWSARSLSGSVIEEGEKVIIEKIDGVKLIVREV